MGTVYCSLCAAANSPGTEELFTQANRVKVAPQWCHQNVRLTLHEPWHQFVSSKFHQKKNKKKQQPNNNVFSLEGQSETTEWKSSSRQVCAHGCRCWSEDLIFQVLWCLDTTMLPGVCCLTAASKLRGWDKPRQTYFKSCGRLRDLDGTFKNNLGALWKKKATQHKTNTTI